uniref:Uncharacterized protein n=1 Tax=Timema shepardi TaxID=629360 RepID=A0A7R9AMA8_TIMSH|nr:unnamed protein product [Timema shepardi]
MLRLFVPDVCAGPGSSASMNKSSTLPLPHRANLERPSSSSARDREGYYSDRNELIRDRERERERERERDRGYLSDHNSRCASCLGESARAQWFRHSDGWRSGSSNFGSGSGSGLVPSGSTSGQGTHKRSPWDSLPSLRNEGSLGDSGYKSNRADSFEMRLNLDQIISILDDDDDDENILEAKVFMSPPENRLLSYENSEYEDFINPDINHLSGVYRLDQNISTYRVNVRMKKYWQMIMFPLNASMNNASQLYRLTSKGKEDKLYLLGFTRFIVQTYPSKYSIRVAPGPSPKRLKKRVCDDIRLDGLDYMLKIDKDIGATIPVGCTKFIRQGSSPSIINRSRDFNAISLEMNGMYPYYPLPDVLTAESLFIFEPELCGALTTKPHLKHLGPTLDVRQSWSKNMFDRQDSLRSDYMSDRESRYGIVQQASIESTDSRLCYLTSSESYFPLTDRAAEGISSAILKLRSVLGIDKNPGKLIAQTYDDTSVMSGATDTLSDCRSYFCDVERCRVPASKSQGRQLGTHRAARYEAWLEPTLARE